MSEVRDRPRFRRRRYWINPHFQLRLLVAIWLFVGVGMSIAALGAAFYFLFMRETARSAVADGWAGNFGRAALAMLFLLGGLAWTSLLVTHRIAGPVYRVLRALESLAEGDLPGPMRVRRGDAFQEVAKQLNDTVEALRAERERVHARTDALHQQARRKAETLRDELDLLAKALKNGQAGSRPSALPKGALIERAQGICSELTELFQ